MTDNGYINNNSKKKINSKKINKRNSFKINSPTKKTNKVKKKINKKGIQNRKSLKIEDNSSFHNLQLKEGKVVSQINSSNKEIQSRDLILKQNNKIISAHNKKN